MIGSLLTVPNAVALSAASVVLMFVRMAVPPRRALAARIRPYAALARSRLGTGQADVSLVALVHVDDRSVPDRRFGPSVRQVAARLTRRFDVTNDEELGRLLRQAGLSGIDPVQHRMRQLAGAVAGASFGVLLGVGLLGSVGGTLLLMLAFGLPASTMQRTRIERAVQRRRSRMRSEVYTVAQLAAVHLRTGRGPVEAVRAVCHLGRGPVVEELSEALNWMSGGVPPHDAYERLAGTTPEPAAARLYRLLGASARSGGDIAGALLAVGEDLRSQRRDEVARSAVRRRAAMLAPLLLLVAPVMVLFVGAALPSLVLGPVR